MLKQERKNGKTRTKKPPATDGRDDITAGYVFAFIVISFVFEVIHSCGFTALPIIGTKVQINLANEENPKGNLT